MRKKKLKNINIRIFLKVPLTCKLVEWLALPALLWAIHMYSPACSACTESMLNWLVLLLERIIDILSSLIMRRPFSNQVKSTGKSPLVMLQRTEAASPEFMGLSTNSKALINGGTVK